MHKKIEEQLRNARNIEMLLQGEVVEGIDNLKKRCEENDNKVVAVKIRGKQPGDSNVVRKRPTIGVKKDG